MAGIEQFNFEADPQENKIAVRRIKPEQLKSETPVFVVPGFGVTAEAFDHVMQHLAKEDGRESLAVEDPHGLDDRILDDFFEKLRQNRTEAEIEQIKQKYPAVELKKIAAMFKAQDQEEISQCDAVGFSQGCLEVIYAAEIDPDRFRNLVLVDPAGIVGKHSRATLYKRTAENAIAENVNVLAKKYEGADEAAKRIKSDGKVMAGVVGSNLTETLLEDTQAISEADITEKLENLRKLGIKITIIHGVDDKIFPLDKVFDQKKEDGKIHTGPQTHLNKNTADIFLPVKGTHNQTGLYLHKWMRMVEFGLGKMEEMGVDQKPQG